MIKVGETGGVLTTVLDRLSTYMEKSARLKRKVGGAMIYPMVVVSMAAVITLGLLIFVVPTFKSIYSSFNKALPPLTQALLDFSDALKKPVFVLSCRDHCRGGSRSSTLRKHLRGPCRSTGRNSDCRCSAISSARLRSAVFAGRFRSWCRAVCRSWRGSTSSVRPSGIVRLSLWSREVIKSVQEGQSIAEPLSRSKIFPSMVTKMVAVGEQSGQLDKMLIKVADFFDEQVDAAVENLTSLIEPFIIGFLGIVIGFIVVALFMPILNMTQILR